MRHGKQGFLFNESDVEKYEDLRRTYLLSAHLRLTILFSNIPQLHCLFHSVHFVQKFNISSK